MELGDAVPYRLDLPHPPRDALDRLIELGALDVEAGSDYIAAIMPDDRTPAAVAAALGAADMRVSPARGRDDGSVWVLGSRLVRIGRIAIVPADAPPSLDGVRLHDSDAFGTGLHPTTALCIEILDDEIARTCPARVLDVGTGSGVLALAALRLGVTHVTAVDIDAAALRIAADNARLNRVSLEQLELVHGGPDRVAGAWPLVVANVLAAPLMAMAPALVPRVASSGRLVLGGIASALTDDVSRVYRHLGMRPVRQAMRRGWATLVLQASW